MSDRRERPVSDDLHTPHHLMLHESYWVDTYRTGGKTRTVVLPTSTAFATYVDYVGGERPVSDSLESLTAERDEALAKLDLIRYVVNILKVPKHPDLAEIRRILEGSDQ